jgi:tRNA threonylcarbamoyladenosine biosynthesis protein TsaB
MVTAEKLLGEITLQTRKTHSELLMPHIARLLEMTEVKKSDVGAVAVSIGPGSFTGLRIGLATAKALAYSLKIPIVGVPTLAALAYGCPIPGVMLAPMLDAQQGNVYLALYRWREGDLEEFSPATVLSFAEAIKVLQQQEGPVVPLGEVAAANLEYIRSVGNNLVLAEPHIIMPRAASVAILGQKMLRQGVRHDVMALEPFYIRRSEAEVLWEKRHGACV